MYSKYYTSYDSILWKLVLTPLDNPPHGLALINLKLLPFPDVSDISTVT